MTTTRSAARPDGAEVTTSRLLARTVAAEWTRLRSVRSTPGFLAATALVMVGIGVLAGLDAQGDPEALGDPVWAVTSLAAFPAQLVLLALVVVATTSDHTTGGIVPALQWTPRRTVLAVARAATTAAVATAAGVLLALASAVAAWAAAHPTVTIPWDTGAEVLGRITLVLGAGTLLAAGLGFLLRSTAAGLVAVFLLVLVLPILLPQFGYATLTGVADVLPGTNALFLLVGEPLDRGHTDLSASLTMLGWAAALLVLGGLRLVRSDAQR